MMLNNKSFTLIELLIVIAIITILVAISIVGFNIFADRAHDARAIASFTDIQILGATERLARRPLNFADPTHRVKTEIIPKIEADLGGNLVFIHSDAQYFCAYAQLLDGRTWCVDSAGFNDAIVLANFCSAENFRCPEVVLVAHPQISVTLTSLDFGNINIDASRDLNFTVTNIGGGTLIGSVTGLATPFRCIGICDYSLIGGQSHTIIIRFSPTAAILSEGTAIFSGGGGANRPVTGTGVVVIVARDLQGYAWSENIGWIDFRPATHGGVVMEVDGTLTGYAWSENIGWIKFDPVGLFPTIPHYSTQVDLTTGDVSGWAQVLALGEDGWISMRGTNYGISFDSTTGHFSGWAWSDMVVGWIDFDPAVHGGVYRQ